MTKVISLFGGPGCGKSTSAAYIFSLMKMAGFKCELLTEFAKSIVYQKRHHQLLDQNYIHAKQLHYLNSLVGQVDYVITDSTSILSAIYSPQDYPNTFIPFVLDMYKRYNTINFFLRRTKEYQTYGRNQTLQEAIEIDNKIFNFLVDNKLDFSVVEGSQDGYNKILGIIHDKHHRENKQKITNTTVE